MRRLRGRPRIRGRGAGPRRVSRAKRKARVRERTPRLQRPAGDLDGETGWEPREQPHADPHDGEYDPKWSADGRRIVFTSDRDGDDEILVMNGDGTHVRQVTFNQAADITPAWSPDGRRIVFARDPEPSNPDTDLDIWAMNADGTDERRLTRVAGDDIEPTYSPDGRTIAFASERDPALNELDVFTMNPNGANVRQITASDHDDEAPSWSPDGRQITFISNREAPGEQWDVYTMRRDGGGLTRLTYEEGGHPAWSPDGREIAFGTNRLGNSEVFTMRADGNRQRPVTDRPDTHDGIVDWQPLPGHQHGGEDDDSTVRQAPCLQQLPSCVGSVYSSLWLHWQPRWPRRRSAPMTGEAR